MSWNLWNLASSAQAIATQGLDKVYEILEPPKIESDEEGSGDQQAAGEASTAAQSTAENPQKEKEKDKEKVKEPASASAKSEEAPLIDLASAQKGLFNSWNTVLGLAADLKNQEFVKDSVGLGEILINSTLATLESVGKNTMETVAQVVNEGRHREKGESAGLKGTEDLGSKALFFSKEFEERLGTAYLSNMEALSVECTSRVKGITQSLSGNEVLTPVKRKVEKDAKAIAAYFNVENASEEIEQSTEMQILTSAGLAVLQSKLQSLEILSKNQLKELEELAKTSTTTLTELTAKFHQELNLLTEGNPPEPESKVSEHIFHSLKAIQAHSVISLACFSAKSLELFLRLCETLLLKISERRVETSEKPSFALDAVAVSKILKEITVFLLKDNYSLVSLHVKAIEKLSAEGRPHLDQTLEDFEKEEGNVTNTIFVDIGDAIAFIQEGLQHLQPIVKMMLYEEATRNVLQPALTASAPTASTPTSSNPVIETKSLEKSDSKPSPLATAPVPVEEKPQEQEPEPKEEVEEKLEEEEKPEKAELGAPSKEPLEKKPVSPTKPSPSAPSSSTPRSQIPRSAQTTKSSQPSQRPAQKNPSGQRNPAQKSPQKPESH